MKSVNIAKKNVDKILGQRLKARIMEWGQKNNHSKRKAIIEFAEELSTRCGTTIDDSTVRNWTAGRRRPEKYVVKINEILNEPADKFQSKFDINKEIVRAEREYMMNQGKEMNLTEVSSISTIEDMKNTVCNLWDELCIDEKYSYPVRFVGKKILVAMIGLVIGESLVTGDEDTEKQIDWETVASTIREFMELGIKAFHDRFVLLERACFGGTDVYEDAIFDENSYTLYDAEVIEITPDEVELIDYILRECKNVEGIDFSGIWSELTVLLTEILDTI